MLTHEEMVKKMLENPEIKTEYDALDEEFKLFDELIKARHAVGLTQAKVAERMGTKTSTVACLEAVDGTKGRSPSITALRKYAEAVGCRLEIKLVPVDVCSFYEE
jgi:transcriptional regulator with XRE-family HTH domain